MSAIVNVTLGSLRAVFENFKRSAFDAISFAYLVFALPFALSITFDFFKADNVTTWFEFLKLSDYLFEISSLGWKLIVYLFVGYALSNMVNSLLVRSVALDRFSFKTLGEVLFEPAHRKLQNTAGFFASFWGWQLLILFVVTFVIGVNVTEFSVRELQDQAGFEGARRLFSELSAPEYGILGEALMNIFDTIYLAFIATVLAVPPAFVLSFLCSKNLMGKSFVTRTLYWVLRIISNIIRSVEALIWAIIFSVWVGIGPFAGMIALWIHSIASLIKQYSEIVECVDEGPIEGVKSTGAGALQMVWFGVVPQIVLPYISFTIFRWDINVRMATIIGLVGGGGIGNMLIQYQGQARWSEVGTIILVIVVAVWAMDTASTYIREAIK